jgi:hypothetical protein
VDRKHAMTKTDHVSLLRQGKAAWVAWREANPSTPYYFSIVTYTTLGFGDVRPATLAGEIIVSSEVILGYTTLGLLLSVLAQSIARRS